MHRGGAKGACSLGSNCCSYESSSGGETSADKSVMVMSRNRQIGEHRMVSMNPSQAASSMGQDRIMWRGPISETFLPERSANESRIQAGNRDHGCVASTTNHSSTDQQ